MKKFRVGVEQPSNARASMSRSNPAAMHDIRREEDVHELGRVSKKLHGLYDAIADGLRTPGLRQELLLLEGRQAALKKALEDAPPPAPRFHPRLADHYRELVSELHPALKDPEARTEAAELLRTLVTCIELRSDDTGTAVTVTGDVVKLLTAPGGQVPAAFESSVKVAAGAGFVQARTSLELRKVV